MINTNQTQTQPNVPTPANPPVQNSQPVATQPAKESPKKTNPVLIVLSVGIILIVASIIYAGTMVAQSKKAPTTIMVTPTSQILTPTPIRAINPIATTSAFIQLDQSIKDLNDKLNKLNLADTNIYPPVLDLNLGFSN